MSSGGRTLAGFSMYHRLGQDQDLSRLAVCFDGRVLCRRQAQAFLLKAVACQRLLISAACRTSAGLCKRSVFHQERRETW